MANEIVQDGAMKVFLTGGASAVGRALTRRLSVLGYRVVAATDSNLQSARDVRADGGIPAYCDLLRAGELRSAMTTAEAGVVINLAPQIANGAIPAQAKWDTKLLVEGTAALVEAATAAGVKYLIHTSYIFAGGEDEHADALIDAAQMGEQLVLGGSVPSTVLRFGSVYGADSPELIALAASLQLGRPASGGDAHTHNYWLHAADAASAVIQALQVQPVGSVLNVFDDHPASSVDFLGYFAESQGFSRPAEGYGRPRLSTLLSGSTPLDVTHIHVDASSDEAKSALNWSPRFKDYRQGIDDVLLGWRAKGA